MKPQVRVVCCVFVVSVACVAPVGLSSLVKSAAADGQNDRPLSQFRLPPGFHIERVASSPLVEHPMMGCFDERGRLFLAESAGLNWKRDDLLAKPPNSIRVLDPAPLTPAPLPRGERGGGEGEGRFHKGHVFADKMTLPMGVLWHNGVLYSASPPSLWALRDSNNDGVADVRRELVTKFGFTGNAADVHGPFLGPDGWIWWCDGRHGHDIVRPDGTRMEGKAARIFRLKPSTSQVEVVCGGGMDNPVELAFTAEGEPFATVNILHNRPARNDGLIFCIEGGVYPWHDAYQEFPQTGDLLPAVEDLGWVAPSGLMRYRSTAFGKDYQDNLFSAQFNRNRIQRHIVERNGASFKMKTEDFLVCDDKNFHPTDVLEDADGSLLVIDTGGWFRIGCPTSRIALPDIKGGIYRIRRTAAPATEDPRGLKIDWARATPGELTALLDDARFVVRDRAIDKLSRQGGDAVSALAELLATSTSQVACRNAVWALTRMELPAARKLVRGMLTDRDFSVRLSATHSVAMNRDDKALSLLTAIVADPKEHAAIRREAATALGRLKKTEAIPALMDGMRLGGDRFLDHSLVFALIQIGNGQDVARFLNDPHPAVKRAALVSLDQMKYDGLTRTLITPLLNTDDRALQQAAIKIITSRPGWGAEIVGLLDRWLGEPKLEGSKRELVRGVLLGMHKDPAIQKQVADSLHDERTPASARLLLLETMGQFSLNDLPPSWLSELQRALSTQDEQIVTQATTTVRAIGADKFDGELLALAGDVKRSASVRVNAFAAAAPRLKGVDAPMFDFFSTQLSPQREPLMRLAAASALANARLDSPQLLALAAVIASAGPLELPPLLGPFEKSTDIKVGTTLAAALEKSSALQALPPGVIDRVFAGYSAEVQKATVGLRRRLQAETEKQRTRLAALESLATGGDADRGRLVFFGAKAVCAACHTAEKRGGRIGPDLNSIGAIRSGRDLLEAVVFPSSSFARGFEPYIVETKQGLIHQGILGRETSDALYLINADRTEIRVPRSDIDNLLPGRVSIMPQGLDTQLSGQELRDLLAYLQGLRQAAHD